MPHFVNVQSALRCHDCIHFLRMVVLITNHLASSAVLNQAIVEWNALFKILPQTFFKYILRLSTRRSRVFSFCFVLTRLQTLSSDLLWPSHVTAVDDGVTLHLSLCCCANRFILRNSSPVTDVRSVDAVCISLTPASSFPPYRTNNGSDWRFVFLSFFLSLTPVGKLTYEETFFKAANQND